MRSFRLLAIIPFAISVAACQDDSKRAADQVMFVAPTNVDLSTPDSAVRSWWAYADADAKFEHENCQKMAKISPEKQAAIDSVGSKSMSQKAANPMYPCEDYRYERTITSTKNVSETMAEIDAKIRNISQVPPNAEDKLGGAEMQFDYRYVVIKEDGKWRVDSVLAENSGDWKPVYSADKKPFFRSMMGQ